MQRRECGSQKGDSIIIGCEINDDIGPDGRIPAGGVAKDKVVIASATGQDVVAKATIEDIITVAAKKLVIARYSSETVIERVPHNPVWATPTDHVLNDAIGGECQFEMAWNNILNRCVAKVDSHW